MFFKRGAIFVIGCLAALSSCSQLSLGQDDLRSRARDDQKVLPDNVRKIFKKHCVECHGKKGERAKNLKRAEAGFDFIYDASELLSRRTEKGRRFIVPGAPEASRLFELVNSDEMPDEAAYFVRPAVEEADKEVLRKWIESLGPKPIGTR